MPGVYGEMLAYFPELMLEYKIFSLPQKIGAGVGQRVFYKNIDAYLARDSGGPESVVTNVRTENQKATFYCYDEIPSGDIKQGLYVEDNGEIFQFVFDNNFVREAGLSAHSLQLMTGNTDKQAQHGRVNLGLDEYR